MRGVWLCPFNGAIGGSPYGSALAVGFQQVADVASLGLLMGGEISPREASLGVVLDIDGRVVFVL